VIAAVSPDMYIVVAIKLASIEGDSFFGRAKVQSLSQSAAEQSLPADIQACHSGTASQFSCSISVAELPWLCSGYLAQSQVDLLTSIC